MSQNADSDNRQYVRLPKAYQVEVKELAFPMSNSRVIESFSSDISAGGVCIEASSPIAEGTTMQVRVNIPTLNKYSSSFFKVYENDAEQYFMAIAKVVWSKPQGGRYLIGMEFVNVDSTQANALKGLINKVVRESEAKS